jgi:HD-GYP domain-containing protein (c-di-GMP phosphodiesterase class II)
LLHDIGKVGVPSDVLLSPAALSEAQMSKVRMHPLIGRELLRYRPAVQVCVPVVLGHHERMDGSGYPYSAKGSEIPLHARIVAVADVFDAMTSPRPYRGALSRDVVLQHLTIEADCKRLDGKIVRVLADSMRGDSQRHAARTCAALTMSHE